MSKPYAYILIGLPAVGKSTWTKKMLADWDARENNAIVLSSDNIIDVYARQNGKTYNDVFIEYIGEAQKQMWREAELAVAAGLDIVWDNTHLTTAARTKKLEYLGDKYVKVGVEFLIPSAFKDEWKKRLASRPGKVIPPEVLIGMQDRYEEPRLEEGFDMLVTTDTFSEPAQ